MNPRLLAFSLLCFHLIAPRSQAEVNLALGKTAVADAQYFPAIYAPSSAVDGDTATV